MRYLTKANVLVLSGSLTLLMVILLVLGYSDSCYATRWCTHLFESYGVLNYLLYIGWAPVVLLFSVITGLLDNKVFTSWAVVSVLWVTVSLVIANLVPDVGEGLISVPVKFYAILGLYALYALISLIIIIVQSIRVYWLKK
jgi:hypothetical protein